MTLTEALVIGTAIGTAIGACVFIVTLFYGR
jgi:hypothetical protein